MKKCSNCGNEVSDFANNCRNCGSVITRLHKETVSKSDNKPLTETDLRLEKLERDVTEINRVLGEYGRLSVLANRLKKP